ncbi:helix-turn-helix domain-containing protein [Desulfobulbus alkaliphilus]|uniref:helix-turn-helix domain-containing protein n=1 Tax=Desulfobulbus alkaliphilus TaxID=869814 RepID=UPI0019649FDD|nr:XRE family transcriptional regulator [Desulfobulbus alkaliphilus]MBM9536750.1 helix-turn-helix domain-containing protein [Desulfobulbus alkaliphilus]
MKDEFGKRLLSARKMAGMSLEALSQATGSLVSKQAISKYEKGKASPGSEVLIALARALGVKVDYFFRSSQVTIEGLSFRKKTRLAAKERNRITYQTIEFLQKYLEIEQIFNIGHEANIPIARKRIKTREDIEQAAAEIRRSWNLGEGPIPQLTELLEDHGFKIYEVEGDENFAGLSGYASGIRIPVIAVSRGGDCVRKRFTIAHELAHLLLNFSDCEEKHHEKLCHAFAGALLLPESVIREELGEIRKKVTQWELKKLKGIYGISMQAIMARAHTLGIIDDQSYRMFSIYVSINGWRKDEPGEYSGKERANRFKQLVLHAAAEQVISYSKGAELLGLTLGQFEREIHIVS